MNGNDVVDVQRLDLTERIRMRRRSALGISDDPEPAPAPPETPIERMRRVGDEEYGRMTGRTSSGRSSDGHRVRLLDLTDRVRALRARSEG